MKKIFSFIVIIILASCSPSYDTGNADLDLKLKELDELKSELKRINQEISTKEAEIIALDPSRAIKPKLIATETIAPEGFSHYINLQGMVNSTNTSYVAPRNGAGGYVKKLHVKEGNAVKKGQLLLELDDQVLKQNIQTLQVQLNLAQDVYDRTKSLWDEGIGTEVQMLSSKTNVETLQSQIKQLQEQINTFKVYADQSGIADVVNIKVGELFTGMTAMGPQIQIVNNSELSVIVDVPENYVSQISQGDKVLVEIPALYKSINSTITRLSQSINVSSRSYTAEIKIPTTKDMKPNMVAYVKILNHSNSKAIVVPVNIVQNDNKGKFVFVMKSEGDKSIASKKEVTLGDIYEDNIEILSGLEPGDIIITQGYQSLYEGQIVTNDSKNI